MTTQDAERREFLAEHAPTLNLDTDSPALAPALLRTNPDVKLAPKDVDPHQMPVTDIVFDPRLLEEFPSLEGEGMAAASRKIFALYKSHGRNKDRNSLLHRRIGQFIAEERRSRETGGHVREKVKASKGQRELANVLAHYNITTAEELAKALGTTEGS